ncbi:MAG: hypothetical protein WD423_15150 [Rhodothermales bacterium]
MCRKAGLYLVYAAAALVSAIAFTPLVIPSGVIEPWLFGMPRTMWAGIVVTITLVFLASLAAKLSPTDAEDPEDAGRSEESRA